MQCRRLRQRSHLNAFVYCVCETAGTIAVVVAVVGVVGVEGVVADVHATVHLGVHNLEERGERERVRERLLGKSKDVVQARNKNSVWRVPCVRTSV